MVNGKQIRAARAWLGMSQDEAAKAASMTKRTIAEIESGKRVPHDRTLRDLQMMLEQAGVEFIFEEARGVGIRERK